MRLTQRLLLGFLVIIGLLAALVVTTIDRRLRARLTDEMAGQLVGEARLVGTMWTERTDPDSLADAAGALLRHHVTLLGPAGEVVGDSELDVSALSDLEQESDQPEVRAALLSGTGTARRAGRSADREEIFAAARVGRGVARVSAMSRPIDSLFDRAQREVIVAALLTAVIAAALALFFARSVGRPVIALRDVARSLAAGDLTQRPALTAPGEIGDLAIALHRLAEQLGSRLEALEAEELLVGALTESLNEGVVAIDARGEAVRINDIARRLLGVRDETPFPVVNLPRDRILREALTAALGGEATDTIETQIGGRKIALTARPLARGGAVLAVRDLTPMRRLESVRRDFAANVSHELKTPLTVIGGFAETLMDERLPAAERRQFTETILANTRRMQRIVDDLLDLSRIESGGWVPKPVPNDLRVLAAEAMAGAKERAEAKGVVLEEDIADDAVTVDADPTALRQILANLVDNAVRYTQRGTVTIFSLCEGRSVVLGVRDTGVGIPPEHVGRIFERFYRVDAGRSRDEGGTGLGLAIVRHMVEAHGGRVRAESTVGKGTSIWAEFPSPDRVTSP